MNKLVIIPFFLLAVTANAQLFPFHKNHNWEKKPVQETKDLEKEMYYYTKYLLSAEYIYDGYEGQYFKYETEHYKVKLSTDAAIEEFNKVYIPMEDVERIARLDARVIKKDRIVELDPKVEKFYSEDKDEQYYYFPLSQLELGDEIEVIYTVQKEPEFDGDQFFFQSDIPIYDFEFYFITPNDAYFDFLAHNGLKEPVLIDTILQKHQWYIQMDSIPAYEPEYFSEYNNTAMKLDVSLRGFNSPTDKSYSPYEQFNEILNRVYNVEFDKKEVKALKKINEEIGVYDTRDKVEKIRKIENFIKTGLVVTSGMHDQTMDEIEETRKANSIGSILMYMGLCEEADIQYQYGFISDRYDTGLSAEIESMYFLQNYFMYFPEVKKYLAPLDFTTRLGYLKADWVPNNGYFLKQKKIPEPTTEWEVRPVVGTTADDNKDSMIIRINLHDNRIDCDLTVERHVNGYIAGEYQTYYYLYSNHKKKDKHEELLNFFKDNSKFKMTEIHNVEPEDAFAKPLIIKGKATELYVPLFEVADTKTIFRLGHLFGEHTDINELKKKKNDFVFGNPLKRSRTIIVTLPEGAKITNLESVFQTEDYVALDDILMSVSVELKGNVLTVIARQEYLKHRYSIENKEEVINAFRYYDELTKMNLIIE
ncbi:MAG: DUF3857 domain-containing protein [Crocinitomicaceae bacterium]|nr:DUF3857 domain-containing protein [Crocinitomicaceae bacterium]